MNKITTLINGWHQGNRAPLVSSYQKNPHLFNKVPKGPHPMRHLYREVLMEHHILGAIWDTGQKELSPFLKLDVWYADQKYCYTPSPITEYIFTVTFKKIIPWEERVISLSDTEVLCKEQILTPEDIIRIKNTNVDLYGENLNILLTEYRNRKIKAEFP